MGGGVVVGWCKPIFVSNPQPSCFGLLLGWVAVAWLGFGVMTINTNSVKLGQNVTKSDNILKIPYVAYPLSLALTLLLGVVS